MRKVILEKQFKKDAKKHYLEFTTSAWAVIQKYFDTEWYWGFVLDLVVFLSLN